MKKVLPLLFAGSMFATPLLSQEVLEAVWVLNEGYYDSSSGSMLEPIEVGRYDPFEATYEVVAEIQGPSYASDLLVHEGGIYLAVQGEVLRLDANSGAVLASFAMDGARKLAAVGDRLFVSRGDFDQETWEPVAFDSYLVWLDIETLAWEGQLSVTEGPQFSTEGMAAIGGDLFVAVNNGFAWGNEVGLIGRFDTETGAYEEVDLGATGANPVHLLERDGVLYSVNNGDWSATSLSRFSPSTGETITVPVDAAAAGCNAAAFLENQLAFQVSGEFEVRTAVLSNLEEASPWMGTTHSFYSMIQDVNSGLVYASETDWFSYGMVHIYSATGTEISSFECGVSPGVIALEYQDVNWIHTASDQGPLNLAKRFDLSGREVSVNLNSAGVFIERMSDGSLRKTIQFPN